MSKLWRGLSIALTIVLVAAVLIAMPNLVNQHSADAANAADFDPGNIISDESFYNGSAMTTSQITSWLKEKNAGCYSGKKCIRNYTENTPTMAADAYCSRIEGQRGESAASVIARVGKACNISQKALLVLLEKEQSLISLRDVPDWKWESATGYGCPDTAPCDAGFGGFFTQMYYGARAYQYYKAHPTQYRHQPKATNSVLYNPNGACGSSSVYIQNYATAGLYNYTPYQPNRAALNNLYGVGDSCSAYGNRNFWRMYSDWFGNPTAKPAVPVNANLVVTESSPRMWLVDGGKRYPIRWESVEEYVTVLGAPKTITDAQLESLSAGAWLDRAFKMGDRYFHVDDGKRFEFASCQLAEDFGNDCSKLPNVSSSIVYKYKPAGQMRSLVSWGGGGWWHVEDGKRHQIPDYGALRKLGLSGGHSWLSGNEAVLRLPVSAPLMPYGTVAHEKRGTQHYMSTKGGHLMLTSAQAQQSQFASTGWLWPESISHMKNKVQFSDRIAYPSKHYLMGEKGLVVIYGSHFGKNNFQQLDVPMLWGVPIDQSRLGPGVLVQQIGKSQIWLVQNGKKQVVSSSQLKALEAKYGKVVRTGSDVTAGLPQVPKNNMMSPQSESAPATDLSSGDLVESATSGEQFIYSEANGLVKVQDPEFAAALGIDHEATVLEDDVFASLEVSDVELNTWGITCGGESYFAADGKLTLFAPDTLAHYPLGFVELPADICATLTVSDAEIGKAVTDAAGQVWIIYEGRKHLASDEWLAENPPRTEPFALPAAYLKQVPTGTGLE